MDIVGCQRLLVFLVLHGQGKLASAICAMALNGMISVNVFEGEIIGDIFIANLENEPLSLYSWIMLLRTITKTLSIFATVSVY